jgi:hypothetical protein
MSWYHLHPGRRVHVLTFTPPEEYVVRANALWHELRPPYPMPGASVERRLRHARFPRNLVTEAALLAAGLDAARRGAGRDPRNIDAEGRRIRMEWTPPILRQREEVAYFLTPWSYGVAWICKVHYYGSLVNMAGFGLFFCEPTVRWILSRVEGGIADIASLVYRYGVEVSPCAATSPTDLSVRRRLRALKP